MLQRLIHAVYGELLSLLFDDFVFLLINIQLNLASFTDKIVNGSALSLQHNRINSIFIPVKFDLFILNLSVKIEPIINKWLQWRQWRLWVNYDGAWFGMALHSKWLGLLERFILKFYFNRLVTIQRLHFAASLNIIPNRFCLFLNWLGWWCGILPHASAGKASTEAHFKKE